MYYVIKSTVVTSSCFRVGQLLVKMSLNTAHANGGVLIFSGEWILLYCDGVELIFDGAKEPVMKGSKKGRLYLTTHRMVFTNSSTKDLMQSFSFPFFSMSQIELEQPLLGANYIKANVSAQAGGNWSGTAKLKLYFKSGGAIEYGQAMLSAAKMASRNMPSQPPPYNPPDGPVYAAPPGSYIPPPGTNYGWIPQSEYFSPAPQNSVFTTQAPPPYPGINVPAGNPPAYSQYNGATGGASAPPSVNMSSAELKAREAEQSAYVNPSNPNTAYIPAPAYYQPPTGYDQAPPAYSEATKKYN